MPISIFILEDNDDLRELYGYIFEGSGYQISNFVSISDFKAHAKEVPDLYLLDISLPDGSGIALCQELKNTVKTSHVPVIMVSAHERKAEVKKQCPDADFIAKPFDIDVLTRSVSLKLANSSRK